MTPNQPPQSLKKPWSPKLKAYLALARIQRPYGIWLLLLPAWWGLALGYHGMPPLWDLGLFLVGAFLVRSAGCIYNDIIDKKFDKHVKRTATRPLVTGKVSTKEALVLSGFLSGAGAALLCSFPLRVGVVACVAFILIGTYPWMKRITYWPQLFLGFTYNIGLVMGWLVAQPTLSWTPLLFYGGAVFWTLGYDTIYGLQDREDDLRIGVKSTAIRMAHSLRPFLASVYGVALIFWGLGGYTAGLSITYWIFLALIGLHFAYQLLSLDPTQADKCLKTFKSNVIVGLLLFLGLVLSSSMH